MAEPVIEIFSVGTELIMGRIQDTNSHWIAQQIVRLGGHLHRITILPDETDDIVQAVGQAIARGTGIIIITGGLGPTPDDRTVEAVSRLVGVEPALHEPTLEGFMRRRNIADRNEVSPALRKMAMAPEGADVFQNHVGWVPCIRVKKDHATIFVLPGPPREMEALFNGYVAEFIAASYETKTAALRVMVDMFEAEVSPLLEAVMKKYPDTYLKAYVAMRQSMNHSLPVDVVATGRDAADAQHVLNAAVGYLSELITGKGKRVELYDE